MPITTGPPSGISEPSYFTKKTRESGFISTQKAPRRASQPQRFSATPKVLHSIFKKQKIIFISLHFS
jgi:hypothetical protein